MASVLYSGSLYAQDTSFAVSLPAQSLQSSVERIAEQGNVHIIYVSEVLQNKKAPALSGQYTVDQALQRLLQGTNLTVQKNGDVWSIVDRTTGDKQQSNATQSGQLDTVKLAPLTVYGQADNPEDQPYLTSGSTVYLSAEQIERHRGTSVGDFLSGIPGVINGDNRNSGSLDVNIRGMQGQGRVPVIVDGASQESSVYRGYNGTASRSYVDTDFISSVSIEKGASSGADATGASGGVVRMSTIGVNDIVLPGKSFGVRIKGGFNTNSSSVPVTGTWGGYNKGVNSRIYYDTSPALETLFSSDGMGRPALLEPTGGSGSIAVAGITEYVDVVAAYARRKNGNYHAGDKGGKEAAHIVSEPNTSSGVYISNGGLSPFRVGEEILNTSFDNESWLLKGTVRLNNDHSLELGWNRYQSEYGEILPTQITNVVAPYQGYLSTIDLNTYTVRYHWNPKNNELIDLRIDTFKSDVDLRVNATTRTYNPKRGIDRMNPSNVFIGSQRYGVTASNISRFLSEIGGFKLEYGGAWTKEDIGYPAGVDESDVTWATRQGTRKESSGFTSVEWKPINWLTLNGSLRYSNFETWDDTDSSRHSADGWSPIASITVEPLKGFQVYGKYGSVLRSPSIFETLKSESFAAGTQNFVEPERAKSTEVGFNYLHESLFLDGDKVRFHAAYFNNYIDDYISRLGASARVNLDYAKMRGFEVSAEYDTGKYFGNVAWNHYTNTKQS